MQTISPDPTTMPTPGIDTKDLVPGMSAGDAETAVRILESRLVASIDLQLVLKHIHWNVVGPNFVAVHEMLDDQVETARTMTDDLAERIATLGGVPNGNAGRVVGLRTWDDYGLGRADAGDHLRALDEVYDGVIGDNRAAIAAIGRLDPVSEDLLIEYTRKLEKLQWFVRSFAAERSTS